MYVDGILFAPLNEYLKIGTFFFLTSCITLVPLPFIELLKMHLIKSNVDSLAEKCPFRLLDFYTNPEK